ncbi:MAG TPA: hypothetical protein VGF67_30175 [Ktedonobacteraceae bacterium]
MRAFPCAFEVSLDVRGNREELPDIALVVLFSLHMPQDFLDRSASITDRDHTIDPLFRQKTPTRGTLIQMCPLCDNHMQRRFAALTAVLFVFCQGARSRGLLLVQSALGTM